MPHDLPVGRQSIFTERLEISIGNATVGTCGINGYPSFPPVRAVVEAEHLEKVILFGNSLGGPVAIEAALLLHGKVLGVVGVDTFQSLAYKITPEDARRWADAFRPGESVWYLPW